ncbi:predicted protein [Histoplasma capsulatum H143]|uniref:Uncharacterized protein n=1 Tax=Ajellomyces capsulatus (strain H143) TaxID=544712 RepID=C6HJ48_AJECH|nr:predicted protein [Histoplasma capsulatum H143]
MAVHETRSVHRLNRATACEVVPMDPSMDPPWLSSNCVLLPRTWALCLESVLIIFQIPVYAAAYFHVWHPVRLSHLRHYWVPGPLFSKPDGSWTVLRLWSTPVRATIQTEPGSTPNQGTQ